MNTIKPCPFCGAQPKTMARPDNIDGTEFYAAVMCYCGGYSATAHHGARRKTQDEAMAAASDAWNTRAQEQQADRQRVPEGWLPTAENVNALPEPVRRFVHELASNCDPAGTVRDLTIARDTIRALESSNRMLRDVAAETSGCFRAAMDEGLQEALDETTDERLKDLVERRLMHAYPIADQAAAPEAPATAVVQVPQGWISDLRIAMEHSAWDGVLQLSDALANIDDAAAMLAAAPEAPAQCDTPSYCASVRRCTADDERRASTPTQASAAAEPTGYSHLAEQVSRLMTLGGATLTERQQDVLAAALKALGVTMPSLYPVEPERTTPDLRTDDEKLADLRGNPPLASYEHKKADDTEGGAL